MKRLLALTLAAGLCAAALPPAAGAQPYDRHDHGDGGRWHGDRHGHGDWSHGRDHWDRGYHRGFVGGGYLWQGRHWGHRNWECRWRHHQRFCAYRYW